MVSTICSFNYYLMDNLVWFAKMGFVTERDPLFNFKYKNLKNIFSLGKTIFELVISLYNIVLKESEEIKLRLKLR
jgi:hypothetical protein